MDTLISQLKKINRKEKNVLEVTRLINQHMF